MPLGECWLYLLNRLLVRLDPIEGSRGEFGCDSKSDMREGAAEMRLCREFLRAGRELEQIDQELIGDEKKSNSKPDSHTRADLRKSFSHERVLDTAENAKGSVELPP